jgi:hypothetical protein
VIGTPPFSYQWRRYDANVALTNAPVVVLPAAEAVDRGVYSVFVTNAYGSAKSSNAVVVVRPLPDCAAVPPDIVGWWCGGGETLDQVAGHDGSFINGAGFAPGKVGLALAFNGNNQLMQVANTAALNPTNALTLEGWVFVYRYSTNDGVMIAGMDDPYADKHPYALGLRNNLGKWKLSAQLGIVDGGLNYLLGTSSISLKAWYHVAMTYDGRKLQLYLNGELDGSRPVRGPIEIANYPLLIGGEPKGPWNLNGRVDELSLYNRALGSEEIKSIYLAGAAGKCRFTSPGRPLPAGLVGWWRAEGNVQDFSDHNNHGDSVVGMSCGDGKIGRAFCFKEGQRPVVVKNDRSLNPSNSLTLKYWIYVQQYPTNNGSTITGKGGLTPGSAQYALGLTNVGKSWVLCARLVVGQREAVTLGNQPLALQEWYHVALTYDGVAVCLYVNGVVESRLLAGGAILASAQPFMIGGASPESASFCGRVDEVSLYDRALSSKELASGYLAESAGRSFADPRSSPRDLRKLFLGRQGESRPLPEDF